MFNVFLTDCYDIESSLLHVYCLFCMLKKGKSFLVNQCGNENQILDGFHH